MRERLRKVWGRLDQNSGFHINQNLPYTYKIVIKLTAKRDSHKISDEMKFWPRPSINFGVTRPWVQKTCCGHDSASFLIGSSSNLLVSRTGLKSRTSSISSQVGLFASELHALERQLFPHRLIIENMLTWISLRPVGQSWSNFIWRIIGVGERLHKVLGQIGSLLWFPWQPKAPKDL